MIAGITLFLTLQNVTICENAITAQMLFNSQNYYKNADKLSIRYKVTYNTYKNKLCVIIKAITILTVL